MDDPALRELARAMDALAAIERDRASAWALAAILDPAAGREARMAAEREVEHAREALRHAKARVGTAVGEKQWGAH